MIDIIPLWFPKIKSPEEWKPYMHDVPVVYYLASKNVLSKIKESMTIIPRSHENLCYCFRSKQDAQAFQHKTGKDQTAVIVEIIPKDKKEPGWVEKSDGTIFAHYGALPISKIIVIE